MVCPGFIDLNALADIDHALFDSWPDAGRRLGLVWSQEYLRDHGPVFEREQERFRREFAISQLIRNGITTMMPIAAETYKQWCEDYRDLADTAEAVTALGIRAYFGPSYRTAVPYTDGRRMLLHHDELQGLAGLDEAVRFVQDYDGTAAGLIRGALLPARIETQTERTLRLTRQAADELGVPVRLHAAQGLFEVERIVEATGRRPLPYLADLGFLAPKTFIPHAWTVPGHPLMPAKYGTGDDIALLADAGTAVIFCPIPTGHYGGCLHTYDSYRDAGVRIVLGTDSAPPNLIKAMDMAMIMMKTITGDRTAAAPADLFRSATLDPAEALGRDDLGRLAVGAQADYFVLDLAASHVGPHADPIRTLIMNGDGRDISRVVVAGRTVVEDSKIITVDDSSYLGRAQEFLDDYIAHHTLSDYAHRRIEELQPPSFPLR
ncbi:chlorohydrolase family protein [Microlunatus elymi]|uniref:chlorohydrolase family protein n=1 Tax=Microlunatus elymi TaxID=2596828 RepID=UPI001D19835E|nr:chlorohydrolase family protein [Microlunatus elymi]